MSLLEAALAAHDAGLCIVRAAGDGTKKPLGAWRDYQRTRPDRATIESWFAGGHPGFGTICGAVSGGLEMVELEGRAIDEGLGERVNTAMDAAGLGDLWDRILNGYTETTPSGGVHILWRCDTIEGNLKLARRPATEAELADDPDNRLKVLIETRGEGGFSILAPSNGQTHPTGGAWELVAGGFDTIATITPDERRQVLEVLRSFDRTPAPSTTPPTAPAQVPQGTTGDGSDRPGDEYDASHDCHQVLTDAGFTRHSQDPKGTHYTRPGKNPRHGSSATVWTDDESCTLFSSSINAPTEFLDGHHQLTPWRLHVALNHQGDFSGAARDWRRSHPRARNDDWDFLGGNREAVRGRATLSETPSVELDDDFWTARPYLAHIRQAAHARQRSAPAVLHVVLARVSAIVPHTYEIPAIVGAVAPLCYFAAVIAPAGIGKSTANRIGAELVPAPDWVADQLPLGSGEGLAELLFDIVEEKDENGKTQKVKKQVRHNVFLYADEGQVLGEIGGRKGATLLPTIRSIWTGDTLGQSNSNKERFRVVPARSYTYGLVVGLQTTKAGALLEDADGGTPQRFGWASAADPTVPDQPPDWPGQLNWRPPVRLTRSVPLTLDSNITAEIRAADLAQVRGEALVDPLDTHARLYRLKVAGLLAILDGRRDINLDDWQLAATIQDASNTTRHNVITAVEQQARQAEKRTSARFARRAADADAAVERRRIVECAQKIKARVEGQPGVTRKAARKSLWRWREVFDDALDHAIAEGWVVEKTEPGQGDDKRTLHPGASYA